MNSEHKLSPQNSEPDWNHFRSRFPVLEKKTYLNSCAYGALSTDVTEALHSYIRDRQEKGTDWAYWVERNDSVRGAVANLIGAKPDEIAVTASASAGINAIASALDFQGTRNKVVISAHEFPTNAQIWYAQERRGARVVKVGKGDDNIIPVEAFDKAIDDETAIVAVTQVCFRNGARMDISGIAEIARERGALLLMDAYQGMGTFHFDAHRSGVDMVVGGMLKYLLGTAGLGYLFIREPLIKSLTPTITGWFAQEDIFAMNTSSYSPSPTARRFEMGTPAVSNCYAAIAGLNILDEIGLVAIENRISELTAAIKSEAVNEGYVLGMSADTEQHGAMITLRTHDENQLVSLLEEDGIVTSCRFDKLRISSHFYNSHDDVDTLFRALRKHRHLLI